MGSGAAVRYASASLEALTFLGPPPHFHPPPCGKNPPARGWSVSAAVARRFARWWLLGLLVAVFPANLHMALHPEQVRDSTLKRVAQWARRCCSRWRCCGSGGRRGAERRSATPRRQPPCRPRGGARCLHGFRVRPQTGRSARNSTGEKVKQRMRLRYARCAHLDLYLPCFKSGPTDSAIARAYRSGMLERGVDELPGAEGAGPFSIEAKRFGPNDRQRVLAVAQPT